MYSAGLLFVLFNIFELVSTRTSCDPATGTFPDQDTVLNKLAEMIEEEVGGGLKYSCALEPSAYLKFVKLTKEQWNKVYGHVKYAKEVEYSTEKDVSEDLEGFAENAFTQWHDDLKAVKAKYFGCVVNKPTSSKKTTVSCLFRDF
ncbi:hypothetical protein Aduo_014428 [Ancylostoma duodenale]